MSHLTPEGIDRQRTVLQSIAERLKLGTPAEYVDDDTSASKSRLKRSYGRLLRDAHEGRVSVLLVWDLDRLTRQPRELEEWLELCERHRVRIITSDGECDTASPAGRLFLRMKANVARYEVEHKAKRQKLANEQRARQGKSHSSRRPFGYTADCTELMPDEAKMVQTLFSAFISGASLRSLTRTINEAGYLTPFGNPWKTQSLTGLLKNPRYAGLRFYNGENVGKGAWPAIVDENTWSTAVAILANPDRRTNLRDSRTRWLLSNLAVCGVEGCGQKMVTGTTSNGKRALRCSTGVHNCQQAEPIERFVAALVVARLSREDARRAFLKPAPNLEPLRTEAVALRARREALAADLEVDELTMARRDRALRERLEVIEAELASAMAGSSLASVLDMDVRAAWDDLDLDRRRAVVAAVCDVTVLPAGRGATKFRPESVEVRFRGSDQR